MDVGGIGAVILHFTPLDLFLLFFLAVVIPVQSALTGRTLARTPRGELHIVRRFWFNIARALLLSLLVLLNWHWAGRQISALGLDIPVGLRGRLGFGVDAALICAFAFAWLWRKLPQERIESARRKLDEFPLLPKTRAQFLLYVLMALVASPAEELLFRGFLFWAFAIQGGVWVAALLSSVVFGLGHAYQGWPGILRTALIGFVFAIGFVLTHSLWWLMIAHITVNLMGGLFAWRVMRLSRLERARPGADTREDFSTA